MVVIPITKVDKDVDKFDETYSPLNDLDRKNWEACAYTTFYVTVPLFTDMYRHAR